MMLSDMFAKKTAKILVFIVLFEFALQVVGAEVRETKFDSIF